MTALQALLLSDGRPGHFRLAEGILEAVARKRIVALTRIEVRRRGIIPARVVSRMLNGGMSPARVLRLVYGLDARHLPPSDLIVSAGGNTLGANICCARLLNADNIFYGSLRRFKAQDFSLVLTSYAQQVAAPNQLMTLKPSATDPDLFECDSLPRHEGEFGQDGFKVGGLILGGNSGTVKYSKSDWHRLFAIMDACHARWGTRWIVSNSPRTPWDVSDEITYRVSAALGAPILKFIDVRKPDAETLDTLFAQTEMVVCCADSSSMLSECVWARKPVIAVRSENFTLPENERGYRDWLSDQGFTQDVPIHGLDPNRLLKAVAALRPLQVNPLDRLADELSQRLPGLMVT